MLGILEDPYAGILHPRMENIARGDLDVDAGRGGPCSGR
jgi:hypothetical protein